MRNGGHAPSDIYTLRMLLPKGGTGTFCLTVMELEEPAFQLPFVTVQVRANAGTPDPT